MIDERFNGPKADIPICPELDMCCKKKDLVKGIPRNICNGSHETFPTPRKCGFHNSKGLGGVASSMQNETLFSQYAEFPWMVALMVRIRSAGETTLGYKAGGSLIHPKIVLTAAHKISGIDSMKLVIRAGEWELHTKKEICRHEDRGVKKVIRHEQFKHSDVMQNNLALLVLDRKFEMSPFVNTVCLPPQHMNFDYKRCFTTGWGKTKFGRDGDFQNFLKKVELPVVPTDKCQEQIRKIGLGEEIIMNDGILCAGK